MKHALDSDISICRRCGATAEEIEDDLVSPDCFLSDEDAPYEHVNVTEARERLKVLIGQIELSLRRCQGAS